jgi:hypothetical protein
MSAGQPIPQMSPDAPHCRWCDASLTLNEKKQQVCARCYRLLSAAGISDQEIYYSEMPVEEPLPPEALSEKIDKRA